MREISQQELEHALGHCQWVPCTTDYYSEHGIIARYCPFCGRVEVSYPKIVEYVNITFEIKEGE
jgi:hypothetical protein